VAIPGQNMVRPQPVGRVERRAVMYVPNAELTAFHARSPWLMFPQSFQELGFAATLVCARYSGERPPGLRIVESSLGVKNPREGGKLRSLAEPLLVARELIGRRSDVVMVGPLRSSLFTLLPLVVAYRLLAAPFGRGRTRFVLKADWSLDPTGLGRWEARLSKGLLVASSHLLDLVSIETYCGVERAHRLPLIRTAKVVRVPLGFPQGTIAVTPYDAAPRDPVVLCVARIARMKGQDVLLKAFGSLAERFPDWSVRLVGPVDDPGFREELRAIAAEQGISERVAFLGFLDPAAIDREFTRASVFCLPSLHSESGGQVKYEAAAFGLPIVTTDVPCRADALEMGCRVVRAGDAAGLALELGKLMGEATERSRVANAAQGGLQPYRSLAPLYLFDGPRSALEV
jgi:glycosyltransferase involved in cell wall biosynthesis